VKWDKERYANDPIYRAKVRATDKAWRDANRLEFNAHRRERYATDPNVARAHRADNLWRRYGITLDDYEAMVKRQDGLCALCQRRPIKRLCVDHCHDMQMLRLLLCDSCNGGFGKFGHDPDLMRAGADYLDIWRIIHARKLAAGFKPIPIRTSKPKKRKDTRCRPTSSATKTPKPRA
jgi:hypothetical protein